MSKPAGMYMTHDEIAAVVREAIDSICSAYSTVGQAMYDEPRERLALRIAGKLANRSHDDPAITAAIEAMENTLLACKLLDGTLPMITSHALKGLRLALSGLKGTA